MRKRLGNWVRGSTEPTTKELQQQNVCRLICTKPLCFTLHTISPVRLTETTIVAAGVHDKVGYRIKNNRIKNIAN